MIIIIKDFFLLVLRFVVIGFYSRLFSWEYVARRRRILKMDHWLYSVKSLIMRFFINNIKSALSIIIGVHYIRGKRPPINFYQHGSQNKTHKCDKFSTSKATQKNRNKVYHNQTRQRDKLQMTYFQSQLNRKLVFRTVSAKVQRVLLLEFFCFRLGKTFFLSFKVFLFSGQWGIAMMVCGVKEASFFDEKFIIFILSFKQNAQNVSFWKGEH